MAAVAEVTRPGGSGSPDWARKYPPLLSVAVALLITLAVLPSALNLPQANPQETLEYAPVPPDDNNDTPPAGNLSALGLGSSGGLEGGGASGGSGPGGTIPPPPPKPPKPGPGRPIDPAVQCSASNQQTFDPLSPPCVPFFDGENFGSTYKGVTGDEIRLLVYLDGGIKYISGSDASNQTSPSNVLYDLFKTPAQNAKAQGKAETTPEHLTISGLRVWQDYFNQRFQTYKRRVHFYVFSSAARNPEARRADAAKVLSGVDPFAVVSFATEGSEDAFLIAMARKGVLNFGSFGLRQESFFNAFPKMIWSYLPSIEQQAESYTSYLCQKVAGMNSALAGPALNGRPRKYGLIFTTDDNHPGLKRMAELVEEKVKQCSTPITIAERAPFPSCCLAQDNGENPEYAGRQMGQFQLSGVTTVLWPGGLNGNYGKAAAAAGYQPEWILVGDGLLDGNYPVILSQNSASFDGHAIILSPEVLKPGLEQQICYQAYREVDKTTPRSDVGYTCDWYVNLFQFMVGVQVAGPRLGPTSLDKGFHSIPQFQSGSPTVPACFYLPGDYTCVKDAQAEIWNASERPPGAREPGCWKAIEAGKRYLAGRWPPGNTDAQIDGSEPCNGYSTSVRFNPT